MSEYSELVKLLHRTAKRYALEEIHEAVDALEAQANDLDTQAKRIVELKAENAKLRRALKPFSDVAEHDIDDDDPDEDRFRPIHCNRAPFLTVGDLRRARTALGENDG